MTETGYLLSRSVYENDFSFLFFISSMFTFGFGVTVSIFGFLAIETLLMVNLLLIFSQVVTSGNLFRYTVF